MVYDRGPEAKQVQYIHGYMGLDCQKILEIGCGNGYLMRQYITPEKHITGIDATLSKLAQAVQEENSIPQSKLTFAQANAEKLPFPDNHFERVIFGLSL
ncbi:MAG: class I SAM-dependent methyltransferase [Anaerolineae bacterium]|nr:class I SAM-dependent methyltransferase [Anaerolineae bacterium]MDQ7033572.1 class I SAM-dependent methyltransferase [Anaerolineae bacterium]